MLQLRDYQEELYQKVLCALNRGYRRPLVVAPCGAGKSYLFAQMAMKAKGHVLILTHRKELLEQHIDLLSKTGALSEKIRVSMILTEANRLGQYQKPSLIVLDEAHLSRSNSWMKVIEFYNTLCVGFTATPIRLDGKPLGDIYDTLIDGVSVKWLIEHQRLAPFEYYAPVTVEAEHVRKQAGDFVITDLEKLMCERAIYGDVVKSYQRLAQGERAIAYCVSVKHAGETASAFNSAGIRAASLSSGTPQRQRKQIMDDFRDGRITVLCNVGIISEGVSINEVSCCLLLRPTESHALYWQQAMRCMRYQPGKVAKIIDCVGNYTRNPMPDEDVQWSITQAQTRKPALDSAGNFFVRVCPKCYKTFKTAGSCPFCGEPYPLHPREIKAKQDIELQKIQAEDAERLAEQKKKLRQEVGRARTYPELMRIAQDRGYDRHWVMVQMKLKGLMRR